ncbi:MAG: hypothetical protein A4E45_01555 [Methanosaeta sp. PtaB.Bin039]|nr:MAG: hypothetical protein A4E45_01555 [Methanosaeta sp. PtaB.Bin039]OPY47939.1 MAG: hypothetical protein A4E47_00081 [Methanosaeta sp. PtaU1.Bin028]
MAKERCCALEILEGRLAKGDISDSEIRKGDLIIRMRAPSCHCLNVGDKLEYGQP